ncbi:hypothetical protein TraAM80_00837 [Trypanosoma rangeli]|uniref:LicD/FKTN/FKRP nucleotidyltransferase domain-containing protein n=1 Tax=Trypanosoma rangeli TaxID=5698 RepID=A0A422P1A8_TRYRA|nr:uncharacterized protein TraAM80_00837 [Trypanosoma rangeli]RNF11510.1 hypothetical protein TraAM80_00837 [Trypanosoma rangeli]|eukprot:RNF11510.1 hypothetical protein TraAM80_00837 [Trypanosoma rangeli]
MRPSSRALAALLHHAAVFQPHIHSSPCVICDAAVTAAAASQDACGISPPRVLSPPTISASAQAVTHSIVNPTSQGWSTTLERRREGLELWLQRRKEWVEKQHGMDKLRLQNCWEAFCDFTRTLTKDDIAGTIDFLDQFCEVELEERKPTATPSGSHSMYQAKGQPQHQKSVSNSLFHGKEGSENVFLTYIQTSMSAPADIERQRRFQRTILDFREVANDLGLPFFVCCGTALGAHREGYFIPHDKDIDVGVFYEDLQRLGGTVEEDAQRAVVSLLSRVALSGHFVLFDICGAVEKGLELRFLHHETLVALDLNVYYTPLAEDAELVTQSGPFIWTASHYEAAASRRHGMYRYRHAPFCESLSRLPFCDPAEASQAEGFLVPPTSYLVEYFGEDWRTPREYTYTEALRNGEYKNIVEE